LGGGSGPLRYEYDADKKQWLSTREQQELFGLLRKEVKQVTGVDLGEGA